MNINGERDVLVNRMGAEKEIVSLLKSLVSFKTTSDNLPELNRCVDFVEKYFFGSGLFVKRFVSNKKPSLVITAEDTKEPDVFFVAHLDIVPADASDFKAKVKDGKVFGRGAWDNKGSSAALMFLMKEIAKKKTKPPVGLMLVTDEEVGGVDGVNYLVEQGFRSKFVVVPDAGHLNQFIFKQKGLMRLKISSKGKAAHGSKPWCGENAIVKLIGAYAKIKALFPETGKNHWHSTVNLGKISGGSAVNVVPDYAEMFLDVRLTENESVKDLLKKIKKVPGIDVEVLHTADLFVTSTEHDCIKKLAGITREVTGKAVVFDAEHGASDIRHFAKHNISGILFMPDGGNVHSKNEYVVIKSLIDFYRILDKFISQL